MYLYRLSELDNNIFRNRDKECAFTMCLVFRSIHSLKKNDNKCISPIC